MLRWKKPTQQLVVNAYWYQRPAFKLVIGKPVTTVGLDLTWTWTMSFCRATLSPRKFKRGSQSPGTWHTVGREAIEEQRRLKWSNPTVRDDHCNNFTASSMPEFSGTFLGLFRKRAATEQVRWICFYASMRFFYLAVQL